MTPTPAVPETDAFLQFLVNLVNEGAPLNGLDVTLQMGGILVGGTIISGADYFDRFAADFTRSLSLAGNDEGAAVRDSLAGLGDVFRAPQPVDPMPNYIHLGDALFFTSGGEPIVDQPTLWRGRIAEVDGFILGKLTPQQG